MSAGRTFAASWLVLMALLAATVASSYVNLGRWNLVLNLAIATAKALIVLFVFMRIGRARPQVRVAALVPLAWLAILAALSLQDFLLRR